MNKLMILQGALLAEIEKYAKIHAENGVELDYPIDWERIHVISCAKLGYLMAEERGVDPILAASACAVHDYGRIITGKQANHAEIGYEPAMEFLNGLGLFSKEEVEEIGLSVKNHSNKSEIGSALEEIVKDADVLDFHQYGYEMPRPEQQARLNRMLKG
ncbi:MAG: HD domain-containing protein [Firmicutes bacterium]|nr:HD domain-containing protein [Bacillota bacterium]